MYKLFISLIPMIFFGSIHAQNVGVGTTNPIAKFSILGNASNPSVPGITSTGVFRVGIGNADGIDFGKMEGAPYSGWIQAGFDSTFRDPLSLQPMGGNLGIGTSSPLYTVHLVNGGGYGFMHSSGSVELGTRVDPSGGWLGTRSNHPLKFYTNDQTQHMTLTQAGNLGIGTSSPQYPLHIVNGGYYGFIHSSGAVEVGTYIDPGGGYLGTRSNHPLKFFTNNQNEHMTLTQEGFLGIGTASPISPLQIAHNEGYGLIHSSGGVEVGTHVESDAGRIGTRSNHPLKFFTNNQNGHMTLTQDGNLGIGTSTPIFPLQIANQGGYGVIHSAFGVEVGTYVDANGGWIQTRSNHPLYFSTNDQWEQMTLTQSGALGIGTSTPAATLDVVGSSHFTANMGVGELPLSDVRLRINSGNNATGLYIQAGNATTALAAEGRIFFNVQQKQLVINGPASGSPTNFNSSYPLLIQGSQQGIGIHLNATSAHAGNNYLYFRDNSFIRGSVAGQNLTELQNSFDYIFFNSMAALEEGFILAEGIACAAQLDAGEVIVMGLEGALVYAEWAEALIDMEGNVGVVFQSNAADYAEWLERADRKENLFPGMIVGVDGGRISKRTEGSMHLMVISTAPLVLGNTPPEGRQSDFEKVAFMGQVPVRVRGKVKLGDYILASGQNDGAGIAVSSTRMRLSDYDKVVGVAWSASGFQEESLINTAVGLNTNHLLNEIKQQKKEFGELKETLADLFIYLKKKDPAFEMKVPDDLITHAVSSLTSDLIQPIPAKAQKTFSISNLEDLYALLRNNQQLVDNMLIKAKEICASRGMDVNSTHVQKLFDRNAFFQRLEKALTFRMEPLKTVRPSSD